MHFVCLRVFELCSHIIEDIILFFKLLCCVLSSVVVAVVALIILYLVPSGEEKIRCINIFSSCSLLSFLFLLACLSQSTYLYEYCLENAKTVL